MFRYVPLIPKISRTFLMNRNWIMSNTFLPSIEKSITQLLKTTNYEILRKMDGSEGYHTEWGNPITILNNIWYALTEKWILFQKLTILLRRRNNIPMEGVTEKKLRAETKGTTIQKLTHLWNHTLVTNKSRHYGRCQQDPSNRSLI